jgi:hypothetical protein
MPYPKKPTLSLCCWDRRPRPSRWCGASIQGRCGSWPQIGKEVPDGISLASAHQSDAGATVLRPHDPALKDTPVWRGDRNEFVRGDAVYFAQAKSAIAQINKYPRLYLRALKNQYRDVDVAPERGPSLDPLFKSLEGCAVVGRLAGVLIGYMTKWIVKHL